MLRLEKFTGFEVAREASAVEATRQNQTGALRVNALGLPIAMNAPRCSVAACV